MRPGDVPWLGRIGVTVTAILCAAGTTLNFARSREPSGFAASPTQLLVSALVVVALAGLAVFLGRRTHRARPEMRDADGWAPPAPLLGLASLVLTSAFVTAWYAGRNTIPPWVLAGLVVAGYVVAVALVAHWSRRLRWTRMHQLALAGGALLTYAWHGFVTRPFLPTSPAVRLTSHVVFAAGAVVVLAVAAVRLRADLRDHLARPAARHSGASTDQISMSCRSPR